jgi:HSP20 family protein
MQEVAMAREQSLETQSKKEVELPHKRELEAREEKTSPGKYYVPYTDIYETDEALVVVMDMPGVEKKNIDLKLENGVLSVEGRIDFSNYDGLTPLYTEYNVGNFSRAFRISNEIDSANISAKTSDGVLSLKLPKVKKAGARRIEIA